MFCKMDADTDQFVLMTMCMIEEGGESVEDGVGWVKWPDHDEWLDDLGCRR
jgi:hypothetical protein